MELFKLLGTIAIDSSGAEKAIDNVGSKVTGLGNTLQTGGKTISSWGSGLTKTVTVAGTVIGGAAIKSAMTFEESMAKINTIANLTASDAEVSYGQMEKAIMDLSNQTGVSASDIAEDVYNAISAGQNVGDAVNFVSNSTKLAKSGFAETGQSLDVLTTILNAYGMEASEVTRVSDILIQTQNLGKTTVGELSGTMGKVIPTAKAYNTSLEQVAAGYTIMTANGISTAETTTYMNSMLNELGKSGTSVSKVLVEKTGKSYAQLQAEGYTLGDCLQIVNDAAIEQGVSFMDMWGSSEAAKAGITLLGDSSEVFNNRLEEMNASTGATDEAFGKLDTSSLKFSKTINETKNILIDLGGTIIEMLLPYLQKAAAGVKKFAEWFGGLDDKTKKLIVTIGGIVIAAGPVLSVVGKVVTGIGGIIKIGGGLIGGIGKLIPVVTNVVGIGGKITGGIGSIVAKIGGVLIPAISSVGAPVLIVIGVIGGLIGIGVALYKNWDEIRAFASSTWEGIKDTIGNAIEGVKFIFSTLKEACSQVIGTVVTKVTEMKDTVVNKFTELKDNAAEKLETLKNTVVEKASELKERASEKFSEVKDATVEKFGEMKDRAVEKFNELKEGAVQKASELRDQAVEKYGEIKDRAVEKITELKDATIERFIDLKEKTAERITEMKDRIVDSVHEMKEKASEKFEELKTNATEKITELKENTEQKFVELKDKAVERVTEMKEKVSQSVSDLKDKVGARFTELKDNAVQKVTDIKEASVQKFTEFKERAQESVTELKERTVEKFTEIKEGVGEKISGLRDSVVSVFGEIAEKAGEKMNSLADKVSQVFNNIKSAASSAMNALSSTIGEKVSSISSTAKEKFESMGDSAGKAFDKAGEKISSTVEKAKGLFNTKWKMPDIKTPHFSVSGTKEVFGLSLPDIKVDWYAKGGVMTKPTAFGINPASGRIQAGGEAGPEAIAPISVLQDYIKKAVAEENSGLLDALTEICFLLKGIAANTAELQNMRVVLSTGETVGALAPPMSEALAQIIADRKRGK